MVYWSEHRGALEDFVQLLIPYIFSSPEPKAHLGEHDTHGPSSVRRRRPQFQTSSPLKTTWPIKAKFYVAPPWEGETKVYINSPGHMTKMAATQSLYK